MKKLRIHLQLQFEITAVLYLIIYAIGTFIIWEFTNPFEWIINIPKYENDFRAVIIFVWAHYQIILYVIVNIYINQKNENNINTPLQGAREKSQTNF